MRSRAYLHLEHREPPRLPPYKARHASPAAGSDLPPRGAGLPVVPVYYTPPPTPERLINMRRPDYLPAGTSRDPIFVADHRAPTGRSVRVAIGVAIGAFLAFLLLAVVAFLASTPDPVTPHPIVVPSPTAGPGQSPPPSGIVRQDIIWTTREHHSAPTSSGYVSTGRRCAWCAGPIPARALLDEP